MKRWQQAASAFLVLAAAACGSEPTAARSATPPRPTLSPLAASISGPNHVRAGKTCTYTAVVSGGTPPYTYQWQGGNLGAYDLAVTYDASFSHNDALDVIVEDANGTIVQANMGIFATPLGPLC